MADVAILIVNGFDRRNLWGTHEAEQAVAYPWIDVCLSQIERHSDPDEYDVYVYDNSRLGSHRRIMGAHGARVYPGRTAYALSRLADFVDEKYANARVELRNPAALDYLVDKLSDKYEYFITMDSDAFPVRDGWLGFLTGLLNGGASIAGVYRDEMSEAITPFVHISGLCMRLAEFKDARFSFRRQARDAGQSISLSLYERGKVVAALPRSNKVDEHFLMGGVYGNVIYHHGAGSRHAKFWTSREEDPEEEVRRSLRDEVFADLDTVVGRLVGAPYHDLPPAQARLLGTDGSPYPVPARLLSSRGSNVLGT